MLKDPHVAIDIVPFHLMSGRGRPPQETVWKFESSVQYFSFFIEKILSIKLRIRNAA